ncbi:MAG TPA: VCBS repeat-containing protein [Chloroflexota bacterium]|nr:VCBS repeat-containing protein [Chloroflexota bacterium]
MTRALALTGLLIAGTASAGHPATPLQDDVVRNGVGDIVFGGGTALAYWAMDGAGGVVSDSYAGNAGPGYSVVAVSDFDGEGSADVLWTNGSHLKLWVNNGSGGYTSVSVGNYGGGWVPFAAGDINGDGKSDLFFRGSTHLAYWLMDGPIVTGSSYAGDGGAGWRVVAIDKFSHKPIGEAGVDVLWTNGSQLKMWYGYPKQGNFNFSYVFASYGGGWEPFAAGDINGDGLADIIFRAGTHIAYWLMAYEDDQAPFWFYESRYAGNGGEGFRAVAVSDYDGDKAADILWTNGSAIKLWRFGNSPAGFSPQIIGGYGNGWQPLELLVPQD